MVCDPYLSLASYANTADDIPQETAYLTRRLRTLEASQVGVFFLIAHLARGREWSPYVLMLAGLVGVHLCLRAVRYQKRRHVRESIEIMHK